MLHSDKFQCFWSLERVDLYPPVAFSQTACPFLLAGFLYVRTGHPSRQHLFSWILEIV